MLWASVHTPTPDQLLELGDVTYLRDLDSNLLDALSNIQSDTDLFDLAVQLIDLCKKHNLTCVQPAGSPAFQNTLGKVAEMYADGDMIFLYAHSKRVSIETTQSDGSVIKSSIFVHEKFIKV